MIPAAHGQPVEFLPPVEAPVMVGEVGEPCFGEPLQLAAESLGFSEAEPLAAQSLAFHDHGDPTPFEQLMLELVNRARANPGAEAARLDIGLNDGLSPGTISNTPKQPLAFHPALIQAARGHSDWMIATDTFSHTGAGGSTASQRAIAAGYPHGVGENIAWRGTTGILNTLSATHASHDGLFRSSDHRVNICMASRHDIGIGIRQGMFMIDGTNYNSLLTTQKFGSSNATPAPYLVGVVYYDFDGDGFYTPGEGIPGIEVNVDGASYFTATASAGGYALPVPTGGGSRTASFTGPALVASFPLVFPSGANLKRDLALVYQPPSLSGNPEPTVGAPTHYTLSPVPGATSLHVTSYRAEPASADGAEDLSRVVDETSSTYSALSTGVKYEGAASYRFAHPTSFTQEILRYKDPFYVRDGAEMRFRSRLGWATTGQHAKVEVSTDGGASWAAVFIQQGTGSSGESAFQERVVSLAAFAGKAVRVRFNYHHVGGSRYPQSDNGVGWYVDAVVIDGMDTMLETGEAEIAPGAPFVFTPGQEASYIFAARPEHPGGMWPEGPAFAISAIPQEGIAYAAWAAQWESDGGLPAGTLANHPSADHNGDGIPNIAAFALGIDPLAPNPVQRPAWTQDSSGPHFTYTLNLSATGATAIPELSTNMLHWYEPGDPALGFATLDEATDISGTIQSRRVTFPGARPAHVFARFRILQP